ncbi:hypothetical protein [Halomonas aestuarii]|uniref:hypothetical protein n=1 Tax=Halomonas aestuarii TaxID=1897729 RepID=UPI0013DDB262|nr:hypothetical protein [Halomonas aestuarii]
MTTPQTRLRPIDSYVLQCWAHQAQLQRAGFKAFAALHQKNAHGDDATPSRRATAKTTPQAQIRPTDSDVLQCWADRAQLQRAGFEAFAAFLG